MSSTLNTSLVILQPQRLPPRPTVDGLVASATAASPVTQVESEDPVYRFSVDSLNITAMKVRLMQRAGKEFGVDLTEYDSVSSYGSAIKNAVEAFKRESPSAVAEIERQLGLDQLGVPLDTLVNAIAGPHASDSDRLDAALRRHAGGQGEAASGRPDDLGLYGL